MSDFDNQIEKVIHGDLDPADVERFQEEALDCPKKLASYVDAVTIHGELMGMRDSLSEFGESREEKAPLAVLRSAWTAVAAAVVAGLVTWFFTKPPVDFEPVATLLEANGARWAGSELPTAEGSRLPAGTLTLVEGMATLKFDSGATVTMEAPATVEVTDEMRCRLVEGSVVADVPESAHGFTIDAPDLEVIDLGTRFGLTANQFGGSHVMVFEGEVEVKRSGEEDAKLIEKGGTFLNGAKTMTTDQEITNQAAATITENADGWILVSSGFGAGKDTFVRRSHRQPAGSEPLMMVKETELALKNERRGIVTFDLSEIEQASIGSAEFILDVEPSGLGFSTLVPDSRFAVFAVTNDAADAWSESETNWENAPAMTDAQVNSGETRLVGEFEILRGSSASAQVRVSSPELTKFLREDANGLATLLVVRLTGEMETQGLVHSFATKEHPNAKAPTLRIRHAD